MDTKMEISIMEKGCAHVIGIDEAGRGPLAGPVVAGAVLVERESLDSFLKVANPDAIKDSKKLTSKKRSELASIIKEFFVFGLGVSDPETIDSMNIRQASFLAMKKAFGAIRAKDPYLLIDGSSPIPNMTYRQKNIIKGDDKVFSIAAASIIAKVERDKIMEEFSQEYPDYSFERHKGYGTKKHLESLKKCGPCPIHRKSFRPVRELLEK